MTGVLLWLAVGTIGGAGALLRWQVDTRVLRAVRSRGLPLGTFAINLTGAAALGLLAGIALKGDASLLLGTALVGSYTTFSTWMFETERLVEDRRTAAGAVNVAASLALGVACVALGRWIGGGL